MSVVGVASRDHDVLELGPAADVVEGALPALLVDVQLDLLDLFRVDADRVAARAEAAVDRAGVERQEERLVDVAVGQAGHRRVGLLAQGVEPELGMVLEQPRRQWHELPAQRIAVRVAPVDERQQVRRDAHAHRRVLEALLGVLDELVLDEPLQRHEQLGHIGDGLLRLPLVVEERLLVHIGVRRDLLPELAAAQLLVRERPLVHGRLERHHRQRQGRAAGTGRPRGVGGGGGGRSSAGCSGRVCLAHDFSL
jgi:hypothetical protein